jgi:hypothetical protein
VSPEADAVADALNEILQESERLAGLERAPAQTAELDKRWEEISRDVAGLARAVEAGALVKPQLYGAARRPTAGDPRSELLGRGGLRGVASGTARRSARAAKAVSRRGLGTARRVAGPRLRAIERRSVDEAGRVAELLATRGHVVADHALRVATSGGRSGRLDRVSPGGRVLPSGAGGPEASGSAALRPAAARSGSRQPDDSPDGIREEARPGDLERWVLERLESCPPGAVLHVECGDGAFVADLIEAGHSAVGADPAAEAGSSKFARSGALECLGAQARHSLGGLVVSGATERVSPGSARALVHLASTRLRPGGIVVLVSAHPPAAGAGDPISADLLSRRPLHPVTWCHLLARFGFAEITVFDRHGGFARADAGAVENGIGGTGASRNGNPGVYAVGAKRP